MRMQLNPKVSCGIRNAVVDMIELDEEESKNAVVESLLKPEYNLGDGRNQFWGLR